MADDNELNYGDSRVAAHLIFSSINSAITLQVTRRLIQEKTRAFVEEEALLSQKTMRFGQMCSENNGISILFNPSIKKDGNGGTISVESPLSDHARVLFPLYEKFDNGKLRQIHGIAHVCRVALWVKKWYVLYQQYDANFLLTD